MGQVAVADIGVTLMVGLSVRRRIHKTDTKTRCTHLAIEGISSSKPGLEGDVVTVVEVVGLLCDLLDAQRPVGKRPGGGHLLLGLSAMTLCSKVQQIHTLQGGSLCCMNGGTLVIRR